MSDERGSEEERQPTLEGLPNDDAEYVKIAEAVVKAMKERDHLNEEERQYLRDEIARRQRWQEMRRKITTNAIGGLVIASLVAIYNMIIHPVVYEAGAAVVDFVQRKWGLR
jgi:hypothetical protein